jgi:hypothetical protein
MSVSILINPFIILVNITAMPTNLSIILRCAQDEKKGLSGYAALRMYSCF